MATYYSYDKIHISELDGKKFGQLKPTDIIRQGCFRVGRQSFASTVKKKKYEIPSAWIGSQVQSYTSVYHLETGLEVNVWEEIVHPEDHIEQPAAPAAPVAETPAPQFQLLCADDLIKRNDFVILCVENPSNQLAESRKIQSVWVGRTVSEYASFRMQKFGDVIRVYRPKSSIVGTHNRFIMDSLTSRFIILDTNDIVEPYDLAIGSSFPRELADAAYNLHKFRGTCPKEGYLTCGNPGYGNGFHTVASVITQSNAVSVIRKISGEEKKRPRIGMRRVEVLPLP